MIERGRTPINVPSEMVRALIGEGSIDAMSFRRNRIERFWPCGCYVSFHFHKLENLDWTPCGAHVPKA